MDIKSIVRVFRFGELQSRADRDPSQKRPPTIKFLGVVLTLGLVVLAIAVIVGQSDPSDEGGGPLEVTDTTSPTTTSPTTPSASDAPSDDARMDPPAAAHD